MRIVSLVPSMTATIADLGLREKIVGCTNFCVLPKGIYKDASVIGGTKDPNLEAIRALEPTHILVNEEENKPEHIEACRKIAKTISCLPIEIEDSFALIERLGKEFGAEEIAKELCDEGRRHLDYVRSAKSFLEGKRFVYLVWNNPYMAARANTFVSKVMELLKMENVYTAGEPRYPECRIEDLMHDEIVDVVLFSSEPYPFRKRDVEQFEKLWDNDLSMPDVYKVDGQLCSWWGSLSVKMLRSMRTLIDTHESALLHHFND